MRYAVIENGVVDNIIELDPVELTERSVEIDGHAVTIPPFAPPGKTLIGSEVAQIGDEYDGTNFLVPLPPPPPPPDKYKVSKRVLVERLNKAGLFTQAFTALGGPGAFQYERWSASVEVDPENPDVLALLNGLQGADVANLLRKGDEI